MQALTIRYLWEVQEILETLNRVDNFFYHIHELVKAINLLFSNLKLNDSYSQWKL